MAATEDGQIFTTVYGAGCVRRFDRGTGAIADITVPDAHPAGCAVDPLRRWPLIVTGSETGTLFALLDSGQAS